MVRDESSGSGHRPQTEPEAGAPQATPSHLRAPEAPLGTGNLTHELAQLLAATIAHNQAQRGGGGVPTGADLASLASLMQIATAQRTLAPTFKDGLSALSYSQPQAGHSHGVPAEHIDPHHDDEPMPIPSTWRQPVANESDRWFRQQMGAALLGLGAGLMIVVPTVLWLSGFIGGGSKQKVAATTTTTLAPAGDFARSVEMKTVKVQVRPIERQNEAASQFITGSVDAKVASAPDPIRQSEATATIATAKADPQRGRVEELLSHAQRRIEGGDIAGAREILAGADGQALGAASFAMAETYDPNMLAAWGRREAVADVEKARALYDKALNLGVGKAQMRLQNLK